MDPRKDASAVDATYGVWQTPGMEKTTVYLAEGTRQGLAALSKRTRRPQAELIREALEAYLDVQDGPRLPSFVGAISVGGDIARDLPRLREEYRREVVRRKGGSGRG
jgi:hypothetical protein